MFEQFPIFEQLWVRCAGERIQFIDANQGVLVRRVAMKEFMLNQAGQLSKFRNILPEKIEPMHQPQGAADLTFARENLAKNLPRLPGVT